jgi:hypothetical protein
MSVEGMVVAFGDSQARVVRTVRSDLLDRFKSAKFLLMQREKPEMTAHAPIGRVTKSMSRQGRLHGAFGPKSGAHQKIQDSHCYPGKYDVLFRVVMAYYS